MHSQGLKVEERVKKKLIKQFGQTFSKKKIAIGNIRKEFDLVSEDGSMVVEVKSYKLGNETTGKAGYSTTRKFRLIAACFYLDKVRAKRKILVLTNKQLHDQFMKDMDGLLSKKIEVKYIPV